MTIAPDGYYTFPDLDGGYNGLVRVTQNHFEHVGDGEWVTNQDLAKHWIDPGSTFIERLDDDAAHYLADRYGVTL